MSTYTVYVNTISGDISSLSNWRSDYNSMDIETWHGKVAEECNPEEWIEDGALKAIKIESDDEFSLSNRVFAGCWQDAKEGEEYWSEWVGYGKDKDGNEYKIIFHFKAVKGEEPDDDGSWPWDEEHIESCVLVKEADED